MRIQRSQTAVLLFSLPTPLAATHKRLANGRSENNRLKRSRVLWSCMHQLALAKIQAAQLPYVQSTDVLSEADFNTPFSEQLHKALSATLSIGYKQVIVIGNDCPELTVGDLNRAAYALQNGHLPVGYDRRGGVFLFGIDERFLYNTISESFLQLPWQTSVLGKALTAFLAKNFGTVYQLTAVRTDWNNRSDLRSGISIKGAFAWLKGRIQALINRYSLWIATLPPRPFSYRIAHTSGLRAPPLH